MRILVLNIDYASFVASMDEADPALSTRSYAEQMQARYATRFGVADFYSRNLRKLGHEAADILVNNTHAQNAWAREHGMEAAAGSGSSPLMSAARAVYKHAPPFLKYAAHWGLTKFAPSRIAPFDAAIVAAQIRNFKPDVLLNQALDGIPSSFIREVAPHARLVVGQIATMLPIDDFRCYDLMISSLPNVVRHFRDGGLEAELNRLAFEADILNDLPALAPRIGASFVGSFAPIHAERTRLIREIADDVDLQIWGSLEVKPPAGSPILRRYRGPAFGLDMYRILRESRMTFNSHITAVAQNYANNMRLFEATGVGTLLVTDFKDNLHEMFEPDREVVTFRSAAEAKEKMLYYLEHEDERVAIARAGQQRTLRDHTYAVRMRELSAILERYL